MKQYVITLSQYFPNTHVRHGDPTRFIEKMTSGVKKHTIRANADLWVKRFKKIESGEACLSIRVWTGKPYRSKQKEVLKLTKTHGIGIERMIFGIDNHHVEGQQIPPEYLAQNDGLSIDDFNDWFKKSDPEDQMVIIHFTPFRYMDWFKSISKHRNSILNSIKYE